MPSADSESPTKPVEDSASRVDDDIAVGFDLAFQRRWWRFEFAVWTVFTTLVVLAMFGCFGRGHFAKARTAAHDGSLDVQYDRIERFGSPSVVTVTFGPRAIHGGKAQLWVSESLMNALGNQRVVPQPVESILGDGGTLYTFAATKPPATAEFALQPRAVGGANLQLRVPDSETVNARIFVMP
jgi:hypothetical protein